MSWISDGRGGDELAGKESCLSASYPELATTALGGPTPEASKRAELGEPYEEHRRRSPWMVNSTPNLRAAPAPAGSRPCIGSKRLFASIEFIVHRPKSPASLSGSGDSPNALSAANRLLSRAI